MEDAPRLRGSATRAIRTIIGSRWTNCARWRIRRWPRRREPSDAGASAARARADARRTILEGAVARTLAVSGHCRRVRRWVDDCHGAPAEKFFVVRDSAHLADPTTRT